MRPGSGGRGLILAAAILWGTTGTAQALAPPGIQPVTIGAFRLLVGGSGLLLWAGLRGAFNSNRPWPRIACILAAVSVAAYQPLFFTAVSLAGVSIGTVVAIGSAPLFAGLLGYLVIREAPGRRWAIATALAISGCIFLYTNEPTVEFQPPGVLLALGAGFSYAVYATMGRIILRTQSPDAMGGVVFSLAALILLPVLFNTNLSLISNSTIIIPVIYLGLVTTTIAYILFARGLQMIPVATAVTLSLAEPLTAGFLGIFLLGEEFSPLTWAGLILLFIGLLILSIPAARPKYQ
jgi:drug/metabolite transporter, DME family